MKRCTKCAAPILARRGMTAKERAWVARLEAVLLAAPDTLGLLTVGDGHLTVYDRPRAIKHEITHLHDGGPDAHGLVLGYVDTAINIEAVSG